LQHRRLAGDQRFKLGHAFGSLDIERDFHQRRQAGPDFFRRHDGHLRWITPPRVDAAGRWAAKRARGQFRVGLRCINLAHSKCDDLFHPLVV
jgi:hypothetical protein